VPFFVKFYFPEKRTISNLWEIIINIKESLFLTRSCRKLTSDMTKLRYPSAKIARHLNFTAVGAPRLKNRYGLKNRSPPIWSITTKTTAPNSNFAFEKSKTGKPVGMTDKLVPKPINRSADNGWNPSKPINRYWNR
jgi:hypothetical protein